MIAKTTLVIILMIATFSLFGQNGTSGCSSTIYSLNFEYQPKEIISLEQLPNNIQDSITNHLKSYLGELFYNLLTFKSGLIINYTELLKSDSTVKDYQWQVPTYDLSYYFSAKKAGIDFCCSRITLDSVGNVIDEIGFPSIHDNKLNCRFIEKDKILRAARRRHFPTDKYEIEINDQKIVFRFERIKKENLEYLEVSAHTGRFVQKYRQEIWQ